MKRISIIAEPADATRTGSALMDVIAASIVMAMVLVPSIRIMQGGMDLKNRLQTRQEMTTRCTSLIEQNMSAVVADFRARKTDGQLTYSDANLHYQVICSDDTDYGGINGKLMGISAAVWHDENRNRQLDTNEPRVLMYSKAASH